MTNFNKLMESDDSYLKELVSLKESEERQRMVQIIEIKNKIYWVSFPYGEKSNSWWTYRIEDYDAIRKVRGESVAYAFGQWNELPSLHKAMNQGIATLIDQGKCDMELGVVFSRYSLYKNFKGFKHFPSNSVVEFKLTIPSKIKYNLLTYLKVLLKFKGKVQRIK